MAIQDIKAEELRELIRSKSDKIEIIDVREPDEYKQIHITGSKLIPLEELQSRSSEIDWNKDVIFVCNAGSRSHMAANIMGKDREVKNLKYGIYEFQTSGKGEFLETQ